MLIIVLTGTVSIITHILLMRELLVVFSGNELTAGIVIANWTASMAAGSLFAGLWSQRKVDAGPALSAVQILSAAVIPLSMVAVRLTGDIFGLLPGETPGFVSVLYMSLPAVFPPAFCSGIMFILALNSYNAHTDRVPAHIVIGRSYAADAAGDIAGGMLFTYLIASFAGTFDAVLLLSAVLLLMAVYSSRGFRKLLLYFTAACIVVSVPAGFGKYVNGILVRRQWKEYKVVFYGNSVYGNIVVTGGKGQYTVFSNGSPAAVMPCPDIREVEEFSHLVLLHHRAPLDVLVLGGGAGGVLKEITKHGVRNIDYVELDPLLIKTMEENTGGTAARELSDPRVRLVYTDGRRYVRRSGSPFYDIIFLSPGFPGNLSANRYYTSEFFESARARLNPSGILAFRLPCSNVYVGDELARLHADMLQTVKEVFSSIKVIPGDTSCLYLCSGENLACGEGCAGMLMGRLEARGVSTVLINREYLEYRLDEKRAGLFLASAAEANVPGTNSDMRPSALYYALSYLNSAFYPGRINIMEWFGKTDFSLLVLFMLLLAGAPGIFFRKSRTGIAVLSTGMTGMGFTVLFIFMFQVYHGYLYHRIGLLTAMFMAGLAAGALLSLPHLRGISEKYGLFLLLEAESSVIVFALLVLLPAVFYHGNIPEPAFYLVMLACGLVTGAEFPVSSAVYGMRPGGTVRTAGLLYALDLAGAWASAVLVSIWFLPVYGFINCCVFFILIKCCSFMLVFADYRNTA